MSNMMRKRLSSAGKKESGFTLVEILVTILILGVIAAIAVGFFMNQRTKARDAALVSDVEQTVVAMERYINTKQGRAFVTPPVAGKYPSANTGWTVVINQPGTSGFVGAAAAPTFIPPGFPPVNLSEGASLGIVATPKEASNRVLGAYCIAANMDNSSYDRTDKTWTTTYYYDSVLGRAYPGKELPSGGACTDYYNRVNN